MAAIKVAGSTKKPKKVKITSVTIRENRGKDLSPTWNDVESMTAEQYLSHFHSAMKYYNLNSNCKDLKPAVIKWMENNAYDQKTIRDFKQTKDWRCSITMGAIASCFLRGMPEQREDFNGGKNTRLWLENAIIAAIEAGNTDLEEDDETVKKPSGPTVTIQERVKDATARMTDEIEEYIDTWITEPDKFDPKQIKVLNLLKGKEAKSAHARIIKDYYANGLAEMLEVVAKTDEQLQEGYAHKSKKHINNLIAFYKEIESACSMLIEEAKITRKPKVKKAVSKDKLVEKLKYLKTHEPLKLVSVSPTDILNCKELWVYNVKNRKLGKYVADEMTGPITVKGTTLVGFNEHLSIQKTIRKPDEKLKEFKAAGKIALRKFIEDINATDTKLNGRINEDIILLKATS